jgi:hypothetical protein
MVHTKYTSQQRMHHALGVDDDDGDDDDDDNKTMARNRIPATCDHEINLLCTVPK